MSLRFKSSSLSLPFWKLDDDLPQTQTHTNTLHLLPVLTYAHVLFATPHLLLFFLFSLPCSLVRIKMVNTHSLTDGCGTDKTYTHTHMPTKNNDDDETTTKIPSHPISFFIHLLSPPCSSSSRTSPHKQTLTASHKIH